MEVVVIGGVAAGMSVAAKAKRVNPEANITVYEATDVVSWGACGLPYYVGGFYDNIDRMLARPLEKFQAAGIDAKILHKVMNVDANKKELTVKNLESGETFTKAYDKLMVASGADAVKPPIKNVELKNVFTLKSYADGALVREAADNEKLQNIIVIGAGYIGVETVEAMHNKGKKSIKLIQLDERVFPDSFDKEITDVMETELNRFPEVNVHLGEIVTELMDKDGVVTGIKTNKAEYPADAVIIATGVRPTTGFMKDTGIEMLGNGAIVINEYGETSIKDIYSAGDCATIIHRQKGNEVYIPLATTANKIGRIIGENIVGGKKKFPGALGSACVKVMDLEAGRTGLSEGEASKMGIKYKTSVITAKNQTSYYPGQVPLTIKLIYEADSKKILGGQIIGEQGAVLRVDVIATAIHTGLTTEDLGMLDLCYAPPFATTWDALNVAGNASK